MRSLLGQKLQQVGSNRRGTAAGEFALVAPLLFSMMFGIVEYGLVFYGYSAVQTAANQTARNIAVNTGNIATAEADLNAKLPPWIGPSVVTVTKTNAGDPTKSVVVITADTQASDATPIKIFTKMAPMTLTTSVSVKAELPFDNEVIETGGGGTSGNGGNGEEED